MDDSEVTQLTLVGPVSDNNNMVNEVGYVQIAFIQHTFSLYRTHLLKRVCDFGRNQCFCH